VSSSDQPWKNAKGASASEGSATRPVTTTSAPAASADVGVRADDLARLARRALQGLESVDRAAGDQVVAGDDRDPERWAAEPAAEGPDRLGCPMRIGRAEVADDADAVGEAQGEDRLEHALEQRLVAGLRILQACELGQRQRAFAEGLEHDRGGPALRDEAAHHRQGRIETVARKSRATADPDRTVVRHE
jgi:hypothetical protein